MRSWLPLTLLVVLFGCDVRRPKACFEPSQIAAEPGKIITLENCSEKAAFYQWSMGNGFGSELESPNVSYSSVGDYKVTLYAYSKNGYNVDSLSQFIQVRHRYLSKAAISSLEFVSPFGGPWDGTDGPDVLLRFRPGTSSSWTYEADVIENIEETDLPVEVDFSGQDIRLTDASWVWDLQEVDQTSNSAMFNEIVNPAGSDSNPITVTAGNNTLEIWWELR